MLEMIDFGSVQTRTQKLLNNSAPSVSSWLSDWSDLASEMRDAWITYRRGTYLGLDGAAANYDLLMKDYMPKFEELQHQLATKARVMKATNAEEALILKKILEEDTLYTKSSGDLTVQIEQAIRQHEALVASHLHDIDGQKVTFQTAQMQLRTTQSSHKRYELWQQINFGWEELYPEIDRIFIKLIALRQEVARREGYRNFIAHNWMLSERWDYTPEETLKTLDAIAEVFGGTYSTVVKSKAQRLGVQNVLPWDQDVDTTRNHEQNTLTQEQMVEASKVALRLFDPSFVQVVEAMENANNIDILTRPGKRNYSAASYFATTGQTVVYANLAGHREDMRLLCHELGHTIHYAYCVPNRPFWFKGSPAEVSECIAYIFQHICVKNLQKSNLFSEAEFKKFLAVSGEHLVESLVRVTAFERFQHWLYEEEPQGLTPTMLDSTFAFLNGLDSSADSLAVARSWRRRQHAISFPFRDGSYALATVGALIFIGRYIEDSHAAIHGLKRMMALGRRGSTVEAFSLAGINFPFKMDDVLKAHEGLHQWFDI
jgi:oligoendopeptidase F